MMAEQHKSVCAYPWQQIIIDLTGEVVPCCYWSGYGNTGKPLGNTNLQSIDEIWNSEAYQELRRRNASGDLHGHPCGNCMSYRWANGEFPKFSWPLGFTHEQGYCYLGQISEDFLKAVKDATEPIILYENDQALPQADALHADIREKGEGRYSVWNGWLYFSASDNSSPVFNGCKYTLRCGEMRVELTKFEPDSISGRNLINAYQEYLAGRVEMSAKPTMISLISTADCNIDCPACSQNMVRLTRVQHRPETVPDILEHVPYLYQFIWHGGEPYLIKRFRQFIDEFKPEDNPNLDFGFTSNGTMITTAEAEKLKKFPRINASVSIDSFNKKTFEQIRAGASLDRIMPNLQRLLARYNAPDFIISVGMIICKSNMRELADNLQTAIDYDIGLNLSPVVVYPVLEQLNVFEDFAVETQGWQDALDQAEAVIAAAKAQNRVAIRRVDPTGMVAVLRDIYLQAQQRYANTLSINVTVTDPTGSLDRMRRPGLMVMAKNAQNYPFCYASLNRGAGEYTVKLPLAVLQDRVFIHWVLLHDLHEYAGRVAYADILDHQGRHLHKSLFRSIPTRIQIEVPEFQSVIRPHNITFAQYGEATPDGVIFKNQDTTNTAYRDLVNREIITGRGPVIKGEWLETINKRAEQQAADAYSNFVDPISGQDFQQRFYHLNYQMNRLGTKFKRLAEKLKVA